MNNNQLQIMILYVLGFHTDENMFLICHDGNVLTLSGVPVYIDDGVSGIYHENAICLDMINNINHAKSIFEYVNFTISSTKGICVYGYYDEFQERQMSISVRTDTQLLSSLFYNNHCLAYLDILLQLHRVFVDLKTIDR